MNKHLDSSFIGAVKEYVSHNPIIIHSSWALWVLIGLVPCLVILSSVSMANVLCPTEKKSPITHLLIGVLTFSLSVMIVLCDENKYLTNIVAHQYVKRQIDFYNKESIDLILRCQRETCPLKMVDETGSIPNARWGYSVVLGSLPASPQDGYQFVSGDNNSVLSSKENGSLSPLVQSQLFTAKILSYRQISGRMILFVKVSSKETPDVTAIYQVDLFRLLMDAAAGKENDTSDNSNDAMSHAKEYAPKTSFENSIPADK